VATPTGSFPGTVARASGEIWVFSAAVPLLPPSSWREHTQNMTDKAEEARFWEGVRADYARLQADPQEWADYVSELAEWDHAAGDGMGDE
jgi:hypothetical protein